MNFFFDGAVTFMLHEGDMTLMSIDKGVKTIWTVLWQRCQVTTLTALNLGSMVL